MRSPQEYAHDHIPGAANYPVLDDNERAQIGYLYKKVSPFEARKQGAGLVAAHIADYIEHNFSHCEGSWKPLVYCWRGGSRSGAMTQVLNSIGWKAEQLPGGYKSYRRSVIDTLKVISSRLQFRVLCGRTGVGKSRLLDALQTSGAQVLELEKLANHRGSVLGEPTSGTQPSQKWFESLVCDHMRRLRPDIPTYVEAESRKIGRVQIPSPLIEAIRRAECIDIEATMEQRIRFLMTEYDHFIANPEWFETALARLKPYLGSERIGRWGKAFRAGHARRVVKELIATHYDPFYLRSIKTHFIRYPDAVQVKIKGIDRQGFLQTAATLMETESQS